MWNRNKVVWWQKCLCRNVFIRMLRVCGGGGALLLCRAMCSLLFPDYLRHTVICTQLLCSRAFVHIIRSITANRMYFNIILLFQFVEADFLSGFIQNTHHNTVYSLTTTNYTFDLSVSSNLHVSLKV